MGCADSMLIRVIVTIGGFCFLVIYMTTLAQYLSEQHASHSFTASKKIPYYDSEKFSRFHYPVSPIFELPDATSVKTMELVFYAETPDVEDRNAYNFSLVCRSKAGSLNKRFDERKITYDLDLGTMTRGLLLYRRSRMLVPFLPHPSTCVVGVYAPPGRKGSVALRVKLQMKPQWHISDWVPRAVSEEFYRFCIVLGFLDAVPEAQRYGADPSEGEVTEEERQRAAKEFKDQELFEEMAVLVALFSNK